MAAAVAPAAAAEAAAVDLELAARSTVAHCHFAGTGPSSRSWHVLDDLTVHRTRAGAETLIPALQPAQLAPRRCETFLLMAGKQLSLLPQKHPPPQHLQLVFPRWLQAYVGE